MGGRFANYILPHYFFGAFLLGVLFTLMTTPERTVIVKHPTPFNLDTVTYKDRLANCYRYSATKLQCPASTSAVSHHELLP